jgi:hypothetical protein
VLFTSSFQMRRRIRCAAKARRELNLKQRPSFSPEEATARFSYNLQSVIYTFYCLQAHHDLLACGYQWVHYPISAALSLIGCWLHLRISWSEFILSALGVVNFSRRRTTSPPYRMRTSDCHQHKLVGRTTVSFLLLVFNAFASLTFSVRG